MRKIYFGNDHQLSNNFYDPPICKPVYFTTVFKDIKQHKNILTIFKVHLPIGKPEGKNVQSGGC